MIEKVTIGPGPQTIEEAAAVTAFLKGFRAANGEPSYSDDEPEKGQPELPTLEAQCEVAVHVYSDHDLTEDERDRMAFHAACAFVVKVGRKLGAHLDEMLDAVETAADQIAEEEDAE